MQKSTETLWEKFGRALYWAVWPAIWAYIQMNPPRTRLALTHKGKVLLVKDWLGSGEWTLPGGGLKRREAAEEGAVRELMEETSILLTPDSLKSLGSFRVKTNGIPVRIAGFWNEAKTAPDVTPRKGELIGFMWADADQLKKLPLSTTARSVLAALGRQAGVTL
jgi:8-oxo-dGTP pyrophosphatase MutT (NUDIX family)